MNNNPPEVTKVNKLKKTYKQDKQAFLVDNSSGALCARYASPRSNARPHRAEPVRGLQLQEGKPKDVLMGWRNQLAFVFALPRPKPVGQYLFRHCVQAQYTDETIAIRTKQIDYFRQAPRHTPKQTYARTRRQIALALQLGLSQWSSLGFPKPRKAYQHNESGPIVYKSWGQGPSIAHACAR